MAETTSMARSKERSIQETAYRVWPFRSSDDEQGEGNHIPFPVDICETEDAFLLLADLPGVSKDALEVRLSDDQLTITGRFRSALEQEEQVALREVPGASYRRSFTLSDAVDPDRISAGIRDGVLKVELAKAEEVKPRVISIKS